MATEWTKRDVVGLLDFYVQNLRILDRRFENSVLPEEMFCLPEEWSVEDHGHHSLYNFDLAGIKASGYPKVFYKPESAVFATPQTFVEFVAGSLKNSVEGAFLAQRWRILPAETIALDPRYVAFRTAHDWVALHALILAEDNAFGSEDVLDLSERIDPFQVELPYDDPDEPAGLIAGNPLTLADCGFRNRWDPNYAAPAWHEVNDHIDAIHYFHYCGTFLRQQLRGWPHTGAEDHDPRLLRLELLKPKGFADYVATRLMAGQGATVIDAWRNRPPEQVERDPRFIAHKCAFDHDMILRMARPTEWKRPRAEALEIVKDIGFEAFELLFGEKIEDEGEPN